MFTGAGRRDSNGVRPGTQADAVLRGLAPGLRGSVCSADAHSHNTRGPLSSLLSSRVHRPRASGRKRQASRAACHLAVHNHIQRPVAARQAVAKHQRVAARGTWRHLTIGEGVSLLHRPLQWNGE